MPGFFDVICCSLEDWDEVWRRNQFFVRELLELETSARVLFVEPPIDVPHDLRRGRFRGARPRLRAVVGVPRVWAIKPVKFLPRVAGGTADRRLAAQVERARRELGFASPLLWVNDAVYAALAERVSWPCLYDVTDDWLLAAATPRELRRRERRERALFERAGEVVVCSPGLARTRERVGPVRLITNGVDVERYRQPTDRPADLPPGDTALYVGTLHRDRLDVDLVLQVADEAPDLQLVFVGPSSLQSRDVAALRANANVHLLGPRPNGAVPSYVQHASVLMVPHVVSPFTESLDPLKAYEYLASGRPVVSTPVAGFRDLGRRAECVDAAAFAPALRRAVGRASDFGEIDLPTWTAQGARFRDALAAARHAARARPLRVVYLDHSSELSGAELALTRLLPALKGVEPLVLLAEPGPLQERLEADGVKTEVEAFPTRTRELRRDRVRPGFGLVTAAWDSARYVARLRRRIRTLAPDLIHTNSLKAAVYGSFAARLAGVPAVCHVRDRIAADYLPRPAVVAVRALLRRAPTAAIFNSAATMATVAPGGASRRRVTNVVIHDIVEQVPPRADEREAGAFCVGMVGRLARWKGQHVFLEAFANAFTHTNARALLVGAAMFGDTEYEGELRRLAHALGIAERTEFVGFVNDVYAQFARMDLFVHASVIAEPFGQVVTEAMAAGVPVIASAAGGPLEVIEHGTTGILVVPGDVSALADALTTLRNDDGLRRRLAAAARASVARFGAATVGAQVRDLYGAIAGTRTHHHE